MTVHLGRADDGKPVEQAPQHRHMLRQSAAAAPYHGRAGPQQIRHVLRKLEGGQRAAVRQSGAGLGDQGHLRIGQGLLQLFPRRRYRAAVDPHSGGAQGLQGDDAGQQARPGQGTSFLVHRHGDKNRQAGGAGGQQGGPRLFEGDRLLLKDGDGLLHGENRLILLAIGLQPAAGGRQIARDFAPRSRLATEGDQAAVDRRRLLRQAEGGQPGPVGPEGGGGNHVAAGGRVPPLQLQQGFRVLQYPLFGTGAGWHAGGQQGRAGGAVHQEPHGRFLSIHRDYILSGAPIFRRSSALRRVTRVASHRDSRACMRDSSSPRTWQLL